MNSSFSNLEKVLTRQLSNEKNSVTQDYIELVDL
jgi:hypothetical protein